MLDSGRGARIWEWRRGNARGPDRLPWGVCCVWERTARDRFQSGCAAEGKKCVCHGIEVPYGTEENLLREKGAVETVQGQGSRKSCVVSTEARQASIELVMEGRIPGMMGLTDYKVFEDPPLQPS